MLLGIKNYFRIKRILSVFCSVLALALGAYALFAQRRIGVSVWFFITFVASAIVTIVYFTKRKNSTFCKVGLFICALFGGVLGCVGTLWWVREIALLISLDVWIYLPCGVVFIALMGVGLWLDCSLDF